MERSCEGRKLLVANGHGKRMSRDITKEEVSTRQGNILTEFAEISRR
jgi:hypothetical protein